MNGWRLHEPAELLKFDARQPPRWFAGLKLGFLRRFVHDLFMVVHAEPKTALASPNSFTAMGVILVQLGWFYRSLNSTLQPGV